jgi:hypothetical protein
MIKIEKRLIIFLFSLIFLDLLILSFINRKSLCIQSSWIEDVVWYYSEADSYSVKSCDSKIKTLYKEEIADSIQTLNEHIIKVEKKLKGLGVLVRGFRVHVLSYSSNFMQIHGNELMISANLITEQNGETLNRGLVKSWILQQQKSAGLDIFRLEALTSLFVSLSELKTEQNLQWVNWVQDSIFHVASNFSWCNSPLKQVEYDSLCLEFEKQNLTGGFSYLPSALWFAKKIQEVYNKLSLESRLEFLKNFPLLIDKLSANQSENKGLLSLSDVVVFLRKEILVWSDGFKALSLIEFSDQLLKSYQAEEDKLNSYWEGLDFIFYQEADWSAAQIKRFQQLAIEETNHKIIGLNAKGLWLWPFVGAQPESSLDFKINAKYVIYQSCEVPQVKSLLQMKWSDRILWVQNCEQEPKPIVFNGFLHRGIQYFSLDNADLKFISFYLPALNYLISKNPKIIDSVFALKPMKDQQNRLAELASWKAALWKAEFRAYEVSSAISVIDWFKLPDGTWPEIMTK